MPNVDCQGQRGTSQAGCQWQNDPDTVQLSEEALRHLDHFLQQHILRWSGTPSPSLFLESGNREFYRELIRALLPQGTLLFTVLEYEGKPIAYHFGFDYGSKVIWYKPSFDPAFARYKIYNSFPGYFLGKTWQKMMDLRKFIG